MNKTTTALTEALNYIDNRLSVIQSNKKHCEGKLQTAQAACEAEKETECNSIRELLIDLLQKEREDMQDMAHYGHQQSEQWTIDAENIFNNNFTQYKTTDNE